MDIILYLIPLALLLGLCALGGFFWSLKSGQFEDLSGAGLRVLLDDDTNLQQSKDNLATRSQEQNKI